jgi:chromate transporter
LSLRHYIFLKDVLLLALTAFGGPQAHVAMMFKLFVEKRRYISHSELIELNALCQILPGPSSTQTITAIGFRLGGPNLAYLTLLVWVIPAFLFMTLAAIAVTYLQSRQISLDFMRYIQPMGVGFVGFAAYKIGLKVIESKTDVVLMVIAAVLSYFFRSPWVFPVLLLAGGAVTAIQFKKHPLEKDKKLQVEWSNFILFGAVFIFAAILGSITKWRAILLFENFYRNGTLVFGGGQVLIPLLFTEFVEFKNYLSSEEFLSGYALLQALPGPTFAFTPYIGALAMRHYGLGGQILGAIAGMAIFLPGTFLIFFVIRFWNGLKKYRVVKASLQGINAVSCGMVFAAAVLLFHPINADWLNIALVLLTFGALLWTRIPAPFLIIIGLLLGFIIP